MKTGYIDQHTRSENHRLADEKAALFLQTRIKPCTNIRAMLSKLVSKQQLRTTKGILSIIDIIIALGQRGIPFRGNWDKKSNSEDVNFAFFVNWKSTFHKDLQDHMEHAAENASPRIQNEVISICEGVIRERIMACIPKY